MTGDTFMFLVTNWVTPNNLYNLYIHWTNYQVLYHGLLFMGMSTFQYLYTLYTWIFFYFVVLQKTSKHYRISIFCIISSPLQRPPHPPKNLRPYSLTDNLHTLIILSLLIHVILQYSTPRIFNSLSIPTS